MGISQCVVLAIATAALAQAPASDRGARVSSFEGRVLAAADDDPLSEATIRVLSSEGPGAKVRETKTDASGRFAMSDLPAGPYFIHVQRPGYYGAELKVNGGPLVEGGIKIELMAGEHRKGIDIVMRRGATIRGTIRDPVGIAIERAIVGVVVADRGARGYAVSMATTNAKGEYSLDRLSPGVYYVQLRQPPSRGGVASTYEGAFYPGVPDERQAVAITAGIGDVITGIDIVVSDVIGRGIEGVISSFADGASEVRLLRTRPSAIRTAKPTADGGFRFGGLDNGRYLLTAVAATSLGTMAAWQAVDVIDNVSSVQLQLEPTATVSGRLVVAPGTTVSLYGVRVGAALADGDIDVEPLIAAQSDVAPDGEFMVDGLYGARIFRVIGLPFGCSIGEVSRDGRPVSAPHANLSGATVLSGFQITVACN